MGIKVFVSWRNSKDTRPYGWNPCNCCGAVYSENNDVHKGIKIMEGDVETQGHTDFNSATIVIQTRTGPITVETYHYD